MKSFLLFIIGMIGISTTTWAYGIQIQGKWRWRNNNGTETSATWKAAVNTPVTFNLSGAPEVLRLRIAVTAPCYYNSNLPGGGGTVCSSYTQTDSLQYSTTGTISSAWISIGTTTDKAFSMVGSNAYVRQQQPTTRQIDTSSTSFTAGVMMVSDSVIKGYSLQAPKVSESEWVFMPTANIAPNTTYYFRQWRTSRVIAPSYIYPSLTTSGALPLKLTRFVVIAEDKKAKLEWATASEQNNDRFEVQRSTDQRIWQMVATVKGRGNSSTPVSYTTYDDQPATGSSYYRLQQFDKDGKSTFSNVVFLRMTGSSSNQFAVFPNPAHDVIRFINTGSVAEDITATLSDASGKIIHQQRFGHVQGSTANTLSIVAPPPGIYLLQLTGNTTSETVKLIIR